MITQSAVDASGVEIGKNRRCVKQGGHGLLIWAIYSLLSLAEKEVHKNRRRKVKIIRFISSFQTLFGLFLMVTISPSYGF